MIAPANHGFGIEIDASDSPTSPAANGVATNGHQLDRTSITIAAPPKTTSIVSEARVISTINKLPETSFLRRYCGYGWECNDAPIAFHLAGALTILTQIVPRELNVDLNDRNYAVLFTLLVAPSSSSRKTTAIRLARRIVQEACEDDADGSQFGSVEVMAKSLCAKPRQLVCYGEFGKFLATTENGYLRPLKAALNGVWDCDPIERELVKTSQKERNPRLSLFAGCAPGFLSSHTEPTDWTEGFFARWLVFSAERERTYPMGEPQHALRLALNAHIDQRRKFTLAGPFVGMSPQAKKIYVDWTASTEAMALKKHEHHEFALATLARASANVLRIALLLSYDYGEASSGYGWQLTSKEIEPAIAIGEMHIDSVRAVTANLATTPDQKNRRKILNAIEAKPTKRGDIVTRTGLMKKQVEVHLESLLEEELIEQCPGMSDGKPRYQLTKLGIYGTNDPDEAL